MNNFFDIIEKNNQNFNKEQIKVLLGNCDLQQININGKSLLDIILINNDKNYLNFNKLEIEYLKINDYINKKITNLFKKHNINQNENKLLWLINSIEFDNINKKELLAFIEFNSNYLLDKDSRGWSPLMNIVINNHMKNYRFTPSEILSIIDKNIKQLSYINDTQENILMIIFEINKIGNLNFTEKDLIDLINKDIKQLNIKDSETSKNLFFPILLQLYANKDVELSNDNLYYIYKNTKLNKKDINNIKKEYPNEYNIILSFKEKEKLENQINSKVIKEKNKFKI